MKNIDRKNIWIDLDNSPHVPFFKPIMEELEKRDVTFTITARDCFQVCGLADLLKVEYTRIGKHYGKNKVMKVIGTLIRAMQLLPTVLRHRPALAVSHGSRTQLLAAILLGIPTIKIIDYEFAKPLVLLYPDWIFVPDVISDAAIKKTKSCVFKYPGIKEDVYVPGFRPDPRIRGLLGLADEDIVATIRPPASEAHYHNPESELLFEATIELLAASKNVKMVILPRNDKQKELISTRWSSLCAIRKIVIPHEVIDGLNLIWHSDLVVSGGGTMNREAAALGVPVYSIFRGEIGAVDRYLAEKGRLTLLKTVEDVRNKIMITQRSNRKENGVTDRTTLVEIVNAIEKVLEKV